MVYAKTSWHRKNCNGMAYLIADSGATKTDWRLIDGGREVSAFASKGINLALMDEEQVNIILKEEVAPAVDRKIEKIWFYGAGVTGHEVEEMFAGCLAQFFPGAELAASSDVKGACIALFGDEPGIACIIGTGSACCLWDGQAIKRAIPAGGFILGDEGSGAYLGRMLLADYIKGLLPAALDKEFRKKYNLTYPEIVKKVYKEPAPSRFLAGFSLFLAEFRNHPYVKNLIQTGFEEFLSRNVMQLDTQHCKVGFVGSVAAAYSDILERVCRNARLRMGKVVQSPIDELVKYHLK